MIERGIELTPRPKYPWAKLEVGDSILVETQDDARVGQMWALRHGRRFESRKQKDGSGWRVRRKA